MNRVNKRTLRSRAGVAIVMVLGLLTVTFAVAFAMFRSQSNVQRLSTNSNLDALAQQAAVTGFTVGLRKMHENAWGGVNTSFSAAINTNQTYAVSYTHGDATLSASDSKQPWRVTLLVTGTATDPGRPGVSASHTIQAVAELLPEQTSTAPATFTNALSHTLYQYAQKNVQIQPPCQIAGSVRLLGALTFGDSYFKTQTERDGFFSGLRSMWQIGGVDQRTFQGPIYLPTSLTSSTMRNQLTLLGCTVNNIATGNATNWSHPGVIAQYRLYPGGKQYNAVQISSYLQNTSLTPNVQTNPVGIFYYNGQVQSTGNVSITGTLLCTRLIVSGSAPTTIAAHSLPALDGESAPIQLPALVVSDDLEVQSNANLTIRGVAAVFDNLSILSGATSTRFDLQGRAICKGLYFQPRNEWNMGNGLWGQMWNDYQDQLGRPNPILYYPAYLATKGLSPAPILTVKPESSPVRYVWKDASNTVYTAASGDPGLRWSVVYYNDHYNPTAATGN